MGRLREKLPVGVEGRNAYGVQADKHFVASMAATPQALPETPKVDSPIKSASEKRCLVRSGMTDRRD